jgi:hypothetical protein
VRRAPAAIGAVLGLLAAAGLPAQAVEGVVFAPDHDRAVDGAAVLLLGDDPAPLDSARTDDRGRYRLAAPGAGEYLVHVRYEGYLSVTEWVRVPASGTVRLRIDMPLVSATAARGIQDLLEREDALRLPLDQICREPLRPWEAGLLVGVTRDGTTMEPVPEAIVLVDPIGEDDEPLPGPGGAGRRTFVSTAAGAYWLCNLPAGRVRVVARAPGFRPDTTVAVIRAGTVSWYDALMRRSR